MRFTFLYIIIVGTYVNNAIVLNEMKAISIVFSFFFFSDHSSRGTYQAGKARNNCIFLTHL